MASRTPSTTTLLVLPLAALTLVLTPATVSAQELTFEVPEESAPTLLGNVAVKANLTSVLGRQELASLQFAMVEDSAGPDSPFFVDLTSGDLSTTSTLDREQLCGSAEVCHVKGSVAVQSSSPDSAFFRKFSLLLRVLDVNDNSPSFAQTSFVVNIPENVVSDTVFVLPTATDRDVLPQYKVHSYSLLPSFKEFQLSVVRTLDPLGESGFSVSLKVVRPLDREAQQLYITTLVAMDGGTPPRKATLPLSIDVTDKNDNAPQFEQNEYRSTLTEDVPKGSTVLVLKSRDLDEGDNARVSYLIAESAGSEVKELFRLNQDTGVLTVRSLLHNRGGKTYDFEVVARDNGVPQKKSVCGVRLEVEDTHNDRPVMEVSPIFSHQGAAVVPESAAVGRVTSLLTVRDPDSGRNGVVTCRLNSAFFSLQNLQRDEYKVVVAAPLDREHLASHNITIRCRDGGDPPLSTERVLRVEVSDSNDNSPTFSRGAEGGYTLSVGENEVVGTLVGRVTAEDADAADNAELIYGMDNNGDTFTIDTMLGDIYTTRFLDRETTPRYTFTVYAYDKSSAPLTATTSVVVNVDDKNDQRPVFTNRSYHFLLDESAAPGVVVGQVKAIDGDTGLNARVEYYIVTSQPRPRLPVSVNSSGTVVVVGRLDYEAASTYVFMVTAVDMGSPPQNSSCRVTVEVVDSNDHSPIITFPTADNPSVAISQDTAPGTEIARVVAYDLDSGVNGELRYSIGMANATSFFFIEEKSGVITLGNQPLPPDARSYNVVVSVRDNGVPQRAQQALLSVQVVSAGSLRRGVSSLTLVIALISVTLILALAVFATLLLIRCFDRRRSASEKHRHEVLTKSGYHQTDQFDKDAGNWTATIFTSSRQDTALAYSPKRERADTSPRYVSERELTSMRNDSFSSYIPEREFTTKRDASPLGNNTLAHIPERVVIPKRAPSPLDSLERDCCDYTGGKRGSPVYVVERGFPPPDRASSPAYTSQQEFSASNRVDSPVYTPERGYNSLPASHNPVHTADQAWEGIYNPSHAQEREFSPTKRGFSSTNRDFSPSTNRGFSPSTNREFSPTHRELSSSKRELSPTKRETVPPISIVKREGAAAQETGGAHGPSRRGDTAGCPLRTPSGAAGRGKKKMVSFERDLPPSISEEQLDGVTSEAGTVPVQVVEVDGEGFQSHGQGSFSTFKPPLRSTGPYEELRRSPQQGVSGPEVRSVTDPVHWSVRQQQNALIRAIRGTRPSPHPQGGEPGGDKDMEVWSSSSADTNDSGHGGSEVDVSSFKISV